MNEQRMLRGPKALKWQQSWAGTADRWQNLKGKDVAFFSRSSLKYFFLVEAAPDWQPLNTAHADLEHIQEEKDREILILQEGMDMHHQATYWQQVLLRIWDWHKWINFSQQQGIVDGTISAQMDTLILDNCKKLDQIIGKTRHDFCSPSWSIADSILQACVQKVDEAIYELESPTQARNLNSTPEYTSKWSKGLWIMCGHL